MIDGVKIFVENGRIWGYKGLSQEYREKNEINLWNQPDTNTYYGNLRNLMLKQTSGGLRIEGSLSSFLHGNNMEEISISECQEALDTIGSVLKINLYDAKLQKIEFGNTIVVEHPVSEYLECFGRYKNYRINTYANTKCLSEIHEKEIEPQNERKGCLIGKRYDTKTGGFAFCAYNKILQMQEEAKKTKKYRKASCIPQEFMNKNVLKLEIRLKNKKGIKAVFKRTLNPYDLLDNKVLKVLENRYIAFFQGIKKTNGLIIDDGKSHMTYRKVMDMRAVKYSQRYPEECENEVNNLLNQGRINAKEVQRLREKETKLACQFIQNSNLIMELEKKIDIKTKPESCA